MIFSDKKWRFFNRKFHIDHFIAKSNDRSPKNADSFSALFRFSLWRGRLISQHYFEYRGYIAENGIKSHAKDWEFAFSPDSMEKLIDDGIDAQFLNPSNLQEQVRSIQQSLNSENQVCSESFEIIQNH